MHKLALIVAASVLALAFVAPATAGLPQPPAGTPANGFTTLNSGCLGGLRSAIARGDLAGVTLNGFTIPSGFSGAFNPGDHFGTVAEAAFLEQVLGISPGRPECVLRPVQVRNLAEHGRHDPFLSTSVGLGYWAV